MGTETGKILAVGAMPLSVEKMGPLRGDGNLLMALNNCTFSSCREDGSPSWGRKLIFHFAGAVIPSTVEKMGPLRGDGNYPCVAKAEIPKQKVVTY